MNYVNAIHTTRQGQDKDKDKDKEGKIEGEKKSLSEKESAVAPSLRTFLLASPGAGAVLIAFFLRVLPRLGTNTVFSEDDILMLFSIPTKTAGEDGDVRASFSSSSSSPPSTSSGLRNRDEAIRLLKERREKSARERQDKSAATDTYNTYQSQDHSEGQNISTPSALDIRLGRIMPSSMALTTSGESMIESLSSHNTPSWVHTQNKLRLHLPSSSAPSFSMQSYVEALDCLSHTISSPYLRELSSITKAKDEKRRSNKKEVKVQNTGEEADISLSSLLSSSSSSASTLVSTSAPFSSTGALRIHPHGMGYLQEIFRATPTTYRSISELFHLTYSTVASSSQSQAAMSSEEYRARYDSFNVRLDTLSPGDLSKYLPGPDVILHVLTSIGLFVPYRDPFQSDLGIVREKEEQYGSRGQKSTRQTYMSTNPSASPLSSGKRARLGFNSYKSRSYELSIPNVYNLAQNISGVRGELFGILARSKKPVLLRKIFTYCCEKTHKKTVVARFAAQEEEQQRRKEEERKESEQKEPVVEQGKQQESENESKTGPPSFGKKKSKLALAAALAAMKESSGSMSFESSERGYTFHIRDLVGSELFVPVQIPLAGKALRLKILDKSDQRAVKNALKNTKK